MSKEACSIVLSPLGCVNVRAVCEADEWDEIAFWSGYHSWLEERGYILYDPAKEKFDDPLWKSSRSPSSMPTTLPYVEHSRDPTLPLLLWHNAWPSKSRILGWGQDRQQRDIVIKLVDKGSDELAIYQRLCGCPELFSSDTFACVLPPVDIIPSPHNFYFVVMPRWGHYTWVPDFTTVRAVLRCIICLTEGLKFLHKHRIAHRDIRDGNVMLNLEDGLSYSGITKHRNSPDARYCLFDFNLSSIFPMEAASEDCRLPSSSSDDWGDPWSHPMDVAQGEVNYDPFSFDVACMAKMLMSIFAHTIPTIPMLAPLLDRMITHVIPQRFTAAEAHQFSVEIFEDLSEEELDAPVPHSDIAGEFKSMEESWAALPEDFVTIWKSYRTPPVPRSTRLLRWIGSYYPALRVLRRVRRLLHI